MTRAQRIASLLASLVVAGTPARAQDAAARDPCVTPVELLRMDDDLPRTHRLLASGQPLTIVTLGSSSTAGAGASATRFNYPSRLADALGQRYPRASVRIVNRGINGEDAWENLSRLEIDVLAAKPDLVIWQIGTNAVLRDVDYSDYDRIVQDGIDRMKVDGIEVLLMDLQYAPRVVEVPDHARMLEHLESIAQRNHVPLFRRYAVMKSWADGLRGDYVGMISSDGLHLNDTSYGCLAARLADAIAGLHPETGTR